MRALRRNENIDVVNVPTGRQFDCLKLKNKFDVILLWQNSLFGMPEELLNIEKLSIPVIAKCSDPIDTKESIKFHEKWNISCYFHFISKDFFYELYPKEFNYKTIIFGLEPSLYKNLKPFNERIKNRILLSGAIGNKKFLSRIINDIRNPKWNAYRCYFLRTQCTKLSYIDYTPTLNHKYVGDMYPKLLEKYATSVAADTFSPAVKYWEMTAAGCLTFMEITEKNKGKHIGFNDGLNAIFINENNYKEKFEDYLADIDNPKWQEIALAGRDYALKELNNDKAVESLVELMREMI
tara:strand:+ start:260 stop:1141 length:882 start_codon:yes stop_codon:yes gene_type:complete